jgi:hypothetical protein
MKSTAVGRFVDFEDNDWGFDFWDASDDFDDNDWDW